MSQIGRHDSDSPAAMWCTGSLHADAFTGYDAIVYRAFVRIPANEGSFGGNPGGA